MAVSLGPGVTPRCHGPGCTSTELIEAHIIPKSFARDLRRSGAKNIRIGPGKIYVANPQLGEFDPNILCARCDGILGKLDDYGIEVCRNFKADHVRRNDHFEIHNFDGDRFAKFVLAIMWRASITQRPVFAAVALGPYGDRARDVLFDVQPLASLPEYRLFVERYESHQIDSADFLYNPLCLQRGVYGIGLGGFRMMTVFGKSRPILGPFLPDARWLAVNGKDVLRGKYVEMESAPELQRLARQTQYNARTFSGSEFLGRAARRSGRW